MGGLRRTKSVSGRKIMYYVYLLETKNKGTYIGCTTKLKERIVRHRNGYVPATKNLRLIKLKLFIVFTNKYKAYNFEKYLKSGSGRAFLKKRLI